MAAGDIKWFVQGLHDLGKKIHNLSSDDWRLGITTSSVTPTPTTPGPHWGGTGTTDFHANEASPLSAGSYNGAIALTGESWVNSGSGTAIFRADVVNIAQDAAGFTNGRWGIIYNNTDANKRAVAYVDLGTDRSLVNGSLTIDWYGATNDVLVLEQA